MSIQPATEKGSIFTPPCFQVVPVNLDRWGAKKVVMGCLGFIMYSDTVEFHVQAELLQCLFYQADCRLNVRTSFE